MSTANARTVNKDTQKSAELLLELQRLNTYLERGGVCGACSHLRRRLRDHQPAHQHADCRQILFTEPSGYHDHYSPCSCTVDHVATPFPAQWQEMKDAERVRRAEHMIYDSHADDLPF
jgi:hypothetical protein